MMKLLLGLESVPSPHDVADALAIAICHVNTSSTAVSRIARGVSDMRPGAARSWRQYRP
jgi:hypothetical protein